MQWKTFGTSPIMWSKQIFRSVTGYAQSRRTMPLSQASDSASYVPEKYQKLKWVLVDSVTTMMMQHQHS